MSKGLSWLKARVIIINEQSSFFRYLKIKKLKMITWNNDDIPIAIKFKAANSDKVTFIFLFSPSSGNSFKARAGLSAPDVTRLTDC